MRIGLQVLIPDDIRRLVRALRENNVIEESDGYHHVEVSEKTYDMLLSHPTLIEIMTFLPKEDRESALLKKGLPKLYGTYITIDPTLGI